MASTSALDDPPPKVQISATIYSKPAETSALDEAPPSALDEPPPKLNVAAVPEESEGVVGGKPEYLGKGLGEVPQTSGPSLLGTAKNTLLSAAQASDQLVYGTGGLILPGALGEKSSELAKATTESLEEKKAPELSVDLPVLGKTTVSGVVGSALPYAAAGALTGGAANALEATPQLAAMLQTLGPTAAPLLGRIKNAKTPEEFQSAVKDANLALTGQLLFHVGIQGVHGALHPEPIPKETLVDIGPNGEPTVQKANGDIVQELPPADPVLHEVSNAVLSHAAGVPENDLHGFATWFSDKYLDGKPVKITKGRVLVSQTTDTPDAVKLELSDRDSTLMGVWHELAAHAKMPDDFTLIGETVPHDNTQIAADSIDRLVTPTAKAQPQFGVVAGRGIDHLDDPRGRFQKTLDMIRGIAQRDPRTGEAIYKNISRRAQARETTSWKNEQLATVNEEAARAVRAAPNAGVSAKVDLFPHFDQIVKIAGSVAKANEFIAAGIESVLEGKRQMWSDLASEVREGIGGGLPKERVKFYQDMADAIREAKPELGKLLPDREELGDKLRANDNATRSLLSSVFDNASKSVRPSFLGLATDGTHSSLPAWEKENPWYKEALNEVWKGDGGPESMFEDAQTQREGPMARYLGPWDTYFPLVAMDEFNQPIHRGGGSYFADEPGNPHAHTATGLSKRYAADLRAMNDSLAASRSALAKNSALDAIKQSGLAKITDANAAKPVSIRLPNGKLVAVSPRAIKLLDGTRMWVPDSVMKGGLAEALDSDALDMADPYFKGFIRAINATQMAGQMDLVAHNLAMAARLSKQAGNFGTVTDATFGRLPAVNYLSRALESLDHDTWDVNTSALARDNFDFAVKHGVIPKRVGQVTLSPTWAAMTGAELRSPLDPTTALETMTYGPQGTHIRTILQATHLLRTLNPDISPQQYFKAIAEYGLYTPELEGSLINAIKRTFGPFATAGQAMARVGKRYVLMGGKMPFDSQLSSPAIKARVDYLLSRGVPSTMALWYATHVLLTGEVPHLTPKKNSDGTVSPPTPLFGIRESDMFPEVRNSPAFQHLRMAMTGNKPGERVLDLTATDPVARRGLRWTGVGGAYDAYRNNGTIGQMIEQGALDSLNSHAQVAAGPAVSFATTAAAGVAPHVLALRERGKQSPRFLQTAPTAQPGVSQLATNLTAAAAKANPLFMRSAQLLGLGPEMGEPDLGGTKEERILRFVASLLNVKPVVMDWGPREQRQMMMERALDIPRQMMIEKMKALH